MPSKRVFFLGAFAALAASGADARALLQEPGAVAADPADLACGACKKFVAEGEEYINDPSTLDQVGEEIKKLCEDQAGEQAEMVRSVREARARGTRSTRARDPRRVKSKGSRHIRRHLEKPLWTFSGSFRWCRFLSLLNEKRLSLKKNQEPLDVRLSSKGRSSSLKTSFAQRAR
jgi:hypothetical protein